MQELADERGVRIVDALLDLVLEEDLQVRFVLRGSANGDDEAVGAMLRSPQAIVGFSDAGAHVHSLCGAGDTSLVLARWVRELGVLTLEEGVRALTFAPASVLGLVGRGLVRRGHAADLVVFDPDAIAYAPTPAPSTTSPVAAPACGATRPGIDAVVVNGAVAVEGGEPTGALAGRVLRGDELS